MTHLRLFWTVIIALTCITVLNGNLIRGLEQLSRMLFGAAMNEGALDLREKFNHLISFAFVQNKLIYLNFQNNKRL